MVATVSGRVRLVTLTAPWKASGPMLVTAYPSTESGTTTAPPGPVYPVMVIAPAFVETVNCARTGIVAIAVMTRHHTSEPSPARVEQIQPGRMRNTPDEKPAPIAATRWASRGACLLKRA